MKILIVGASRGLGLEILKQTLNKKHSVWAASRTALELINIDPNLKANIRYTQADFTDKSQINSLYNSLISSKFIPEAVIFCLGKAIDDIEKNNLDTTSYINNFRLNLFGTIDLIALLIPHFIERNQGIFAVISSMSTIRENHSLRIGYSASKSALNKTFENLSMQYLNYGLTFLTFNMGRLSEKKNGIVGISYNKAAKKILEYLQKRKRSAVINIPYFQYFLTILTKFLPKKIYSKYLFR